MSVCVVHIRAIKFEINSRSLRRNIQSKTWKTNTKIRSLLIKVSQELFSRLPRNDLAGPTDLCSAHTHTHRQRERERNLLTYVHKNNFVLRDHRLKNFRPNGLIVFSSLKLLHEVENCIEFSCVQNEATDCGFLFPFSPFPNFPFVFFSRDQSRAFAWCSRFAFVFQFQLGIPTGRVSAGASRFASSLSKGLPPPHPLSNVSTYVLERRVCCVHAKFSISDRTKTLSLMYFLKQNKLQVCSELSSYNAGL